VAGVQAQAIKDLPIDKVMVWDSGSDEGGLSNLGRRLVGVLPPMHEVAKMTGLELPEYLGKVGTDVPKAQAVSDKVVEPTDTPEADQAGETSTEKAE